MSRIYYKKPNGEIFEFVAGRVQRASCDRKYIQCDVDLRIVTVITTRFLFNNYTSRIDSRYTKSLFAFQYFGCLVVLKLRFENHDTRTHGSHE